MTTPRIFLSYSETKSANSLLTHRLIQEITSCLKGYKWKVSDPLESPEPGEGEGITEKVSWHIYAADGVFVECSVPVPNVMYEIGFARALKYPIVFFVNREVHTNAPEIVKELLGFMGVNQDRPLTSDLGDVEYFEYSEDMLGPNVTQFRERIHALMGRLEKGALSDAARLLRRNTIQLQRETLDIFRSYPTDHPFIRFIAGWTSRQLEELKSPGPSVFEADAPTYQFCLSAFQDSRNRSVRAIADLTDTTEYFWTKSPDPLQTSVTERIFVVSWESMLKKERFHELCDFWRAQRDKYQVRVVIDSTVKNLNLSHQFEGGIGYHLLLMDPNVVGGYVKRRHERMLRVECNTMLHNRSSDSYRQVREKSFQIEKDATDPKIFRSWVLKDSVGIWNPEWREVENRDGTYFKNYDLHIRMWIPYYEQLIRQTVTIVQREIARLMRNDGRPLELLEVGYGTGALTFPLLSWVRTLNKPFGLHQGEPLVRRYSGVDRAGQMSDLMLDKINEWANSGADVGFVYDFIHGVAVDGLEHVLGMYPTYSVIFGSLVLHDLFSPAPAPSVTEVLRGFRKYLRPGGSLIWADVFFSSNPDTKERQLKYWKNLMISNGMTTEDVELFFAGNPEMIDGVSLDALRDHAAETGFSVAVSPVTGPKESFPFKIVVLRANTESH
jgi:hypothetical protein